MDQGGSDIDSSLLSSFTGFLIESMQRNHPHVHDLPQEQNFTATSESGHILENDIKQNTNITNAVPGEPYEKIRNDGNEEKYEDDPPYWDSRETFEHTISGIDSGVILDDEQEDDDAQRIDEVPLGKKALRRRRAKRNRM